MSTIEVINALDVASTRHLVDKLKGLISEDAIKHAATPDVATEKGVYVVSNNASSNRNSASLMLVSVFQSIVMQTWYDNNGALKRRRSTDGGETWQDWDIVDHQSAIENLIQRIGSLESLMETITETDGVQGIIDTLQDVKAFLAEITDTETLTGLLLNLEAKIPGYNVIYISEFVYNVAVEQVTTQLTSESDGASIVYNNTTNRLLLKVGATELTSKYYSSWGDALKFGKISGGGVMPEVGKVYIISADTAIGYDIALWNGTNMGPLHFRELEDLDDKINNADEACKANAAEIVQLRKDLDSTESRVSDLEESKIKFVAITEAEIDAMFDGYSMSGPEPVAPTN